MAKCYIELPKAIERLFHGTPKGLDIHRAWIEEGRLVLDLRGPCVPDTEVVRPETVMRSSIETITWQRTETEFVGCSYVPPDGGTVLLPVGSGGSGADNSRVWATGGGGGGMIGRWREIGARLDAEPSLEHKDDEGIRESEDSFDNKGHTDGYGF